MLRKLLNLARMVAAMLPWAVLGPAQAQDVRFERVAEGVYAHIGDTGGRTVANQGLNTNIGLVLTPGGAVLIGSSSSVVPRPTASQDRGGRP